MGKEELIKSQFPNDEFLQSAVLQIVNKCVSDLEEENAGLKNRNQELLESCEGATMMYEDLQKAKDIMKRWIDLSRSSRSILGDTWFDTLREAEDFLSK